MAGVTGPTREIAEQLALEISEGIYEVGGRFPTEMELRDRFGVGRYTIREALKLLTEQGMLGRRRKTGTIVLSSTPVSPYIHSLRDLRGLLSFAETTNLQISCFEEVAPESPLVKGIENLGEERWVYIAGVRTVPGKAQPLCFSEILIPARLCPTFESIRDAKRGIYEETLELNGLHLEYIEQEVSATPLSKEMQILLKAEKESASLFVSRRYFARMGELFQISRNTYPASQYKIHNVFRQRE